MFVAGFTGCAIMMYFINLIWEDAGSTQSAFRGVMLGYSGICALWIPLLAWMMPNDSFKASCCIYCHALITMLKCVTAGSAGWHGIPAAQ